MPLKVFVWDYPILSLRKYGAYFTAKDLHKVMSDPRKLAKLLNTLADAQEKRSSSKKKLLFFR